VVPVTATASWSVLLGVTLGTGLWCIAASLPRLSGPRLADRIAPYIVDVSEGARLYVDRRRSDPLPVIGSVFAPVLGRVVAVVGALTGGSRTIQRRLDQLRSTVTISRFRAEQVLCAGVGAAFGFVIALGAIVNRTLPTGASVVLPAAFAAIGWMLRDLLLQRRARARAKRIAAELPTVLEFLSLSLSAGEGILDSLRRVARVGSGELAADFRDIIAEVNTGIPLATALRSCAGQTDLAPLTRAVDQIVVALERGAPLADVLRAQANDARNEAKRALLESAGKKEVAMLVPLVFFILPLSVMFAVFPGVFVLQTGF